MMPVRSLDFGLDTVGSPGVERVVVDGVRRSLADGGRKVTAARRTGSAQLELEREVGPHRDRTTGAARGTEPPLQRCDQRQLVEERSRLDDACVVGRAVGRDQDADYDFA